MPYYSAIDLEEEVALPPRLRERTNVSVPALTPD